MRALLADIDGVLTDGHIWIGPQGQEWYRVSIHDGWAIQHAAQKGIYVAFFSGRTHPGLHTRLYQLGVCAVVEGLHDKKSAVEAFLREHRLTWEEVSYMGDDWPDKEVLTCVGFSAAPANAISPIKEMVDWVSSYKGGEGAIRQWVEIVLSGL
ncbi:MAG: KdsC family phosphatase [Bacteroidia bacterium]